VNANLKSDTQQEVLNILDQVLGLNGRARDMGRDSPLLGAVPELDSVAVVALITRLEDRFGFDVAGDELDTSSFETIGALTDFVTSKVAT
jgi:acyl carrier protein